MQDALARAESLIAEIPDYPEPGVLFRDVTPVLLDAAALRCSVDAMIAPFEGGCDLVAGIESRGFLLAGAAATLADVGLVAIRKAGKLPRPAARIEYDLEYGHAALEIPAGIPEGPRVLVMDDVLATGGTFAAAIELLRQVGADPVGATALMELPELDGRARLAGTPFHAVF
ncbi:Adenine phosphoribosyltransferase [Pseudoclavibacter triregionum]|nr:Adenine phosphoribosyltransferase [Pseudoclavibacter triregionum]